MDLQKCVFPDKAVYVMCLLYALGIAIAFAAAAVLNRCYRRGADSSFVMEIPPYRAPQAASVVRHTWEKGRQYLRKMGGIILVASIAVWLLGYFPRGGEQLTEAQQQEQSSPARPSRTPSPTSGRSSTS